MIFRHNIYSANFRPPVLVKLFRFGSNFKPSFQTLFGLSQQKISKLYLDISLRLFCRRDLYFTLFLCFTVPLTLESCLSLVLLLFSVTKFISFWYLYLCVGMCTCLGICVRTSRCLFSPATENLGPICTKARVTSSRDMS